MMASKCNPVGYIIERQYNEAIVVKNKLFKERLNGARNLYRKDLLGHYGCVNAIEFSDEGELLISGGDDRRVLLWSVSEAIFDKKAAITMETRHFSNIFCLSFDSTNSKIFSGGNDDQVIVHDVKSSHIVRKLPHVKPVYGLSVNPENDTVLATAGDDGRIIICDIREPNGDSLVLAKQKMGFHSVKYSPLNARLLVTANSEEGIALWDVRKPREVYIHYDGQAGPVSGISACFNADGTRILALRRRLPPALYASHAAASLCQFYHPHYYNSCTMKTCAFAGDNDEYVLSGSDDFNLYMWKVPEEDVEWGTSHLVLNGHRSIVNQVRYNKHCNLIASSGVEKMVKLWSTLPIGTWSGSLLTPYTDTDRPVYSHDEYIYLMGGSGTIPVSQQVPPQQQPPQQPQQQRITHDYSEHSTQEDARMMAFFDSLIQREIEGWESRSEDTFTSDSDSDTLVQEKIRLSWQSLLRGRKLAEESARKRKPNRIAQLIAQKRNRLAKMAHWKSRTLVQRLSTRDKHHHKRASKRIHKFRPKDARHRSKYTTTTTNTTSSRHHRTPHQSNGTTSTPTTTTSSSSIKRSSRTHAPGHGSSGSGSSRHVAPSASVSCERQLLELLVEGMNEADGSDDDGGGGGGGDTSSGSEKESASVGSVGVVGAVDVEASYSGGQARVKREVKVEVNGNSQHSQQPQQHHIIDMPSTSTGITSSASATFNRRNSSIVYDDSDEELLSPRCGGREIQAEEEQEEEGRLVNILPTPLNGSHNVYAVNVLEVAAGTNSDNTANITSVRTSRNLQSSDSDTDSYEDLSYKPAQISPHNHRNRNKPIQTTNNPTITSRSKGKSFVNNKNNKVFKKSTLNLPAQQSSTSSATNNNNNHSNSSSSFTKTGNNSSNNYRKQPRNYRAKPSFSEHDVLSSSSTNSSSSSSSNSSSSTAANSSNDEDEDVVRGQELAVDNNREVSLLSDNRSSDVDSDDVDVSTEVVVAGAMNGGGVHEGVLVQGDVEGYYEGTTVVERFREEEMVTPIKRSSARFNRSNNDNSFAVASSSTTRRFYRKRPHQTIRHNNNSDDDGDGTNSENELPRRSSASTTRRKRTRNSCSSSNDNTSDSSSSDDNCAGGAATSSAAAASSYYQRLRKQRAKKARLNLRKQMQVNGDSDSN